MTTEKSSIYLFFGVLFIAIGVVSAASLPAEPGFLLLTVGVCLGIVLFTLGEAETMTLHTIQLFCSV